MMKISMMLQREKEGLRVIHGFWRLQLALAMECRLIVDAPGIGELQVERQTDGSIAATLNAQPVALMYT